MKQSIVFLFAALLAAGSFAADEPVPCDVQDSVLCIGLVSHWEMEEASDEHRIDEVTGLPSLLERDGVDIGQGSDTDKKLDTYSAEFTASGSEDGLFVPFGGPAFAGIGPWTIAFWVKVDAVSADMHLFDSTTDTTLDIYGPSVYFEDTNDRLVFQITTAAGGTYQQHTAATANSSISAGSWYLVAAGLEPITDPTTDDLVKMWIRLNDGTKVTTNVDYPAVSLLQDFVLGANSAGGDELDGKIDSVSIWGRTLNDDDLDLLYAGGDGRTYPFQ